jgi:hypothetical protein
MFEEEALLEISGDEKSAEDEKNDIKGGGGNCLLNGKEPEDEDEQHGAKCEGQPMVLEEKNAEDERGEDGKAFDLAMIQNQADESAGREGSGGSGYEENEKQRLG